MEKGQKGIDEPPQFVKNASGMSHCYVRSADFEFKTISEDSEDECMPPLERCSDKKLMLNSDPCVKDAKEEDLKDSASGATSNSSANKSLPELEKIFADSWISETDMSPIASTRSAAKAMLGKLNDTIEKNVLKLKSDQEQQDMCPTLADVVRKRLCFGKLKSGNLKFFEAMHTGPVSSGRENTESSKPDETEKKDSHPILKIKISVPAIKLTPPPLPDNMKGRDGDDEMFPTFFSEGDADAKEKKKRKVKKIGLVRYEDAYNALMKKHSDEAE